jgi:molybdopterin-synthase adenylyltransferase
VKAFPTKWQEHASELQACDSVVGCVDSYAARDDLERYARRYLMPYVDIGMDVVGSGGNYLLSGQIIVSMPGRPCMHCMAFLTPEKLGKEADNYGGAGGKPQVIWPNGVLASTAVGKLIALLCPWAPQLNVPLYSIYDGNRMILEPSPRLPYLDGMICPHYPIGNQLGDVAF